MNIFKGLEFVYDEASKYLDDIQNNSRRFEDPQFIKNANSKSMQIILAHKEDIASITNKALDKVNSLQSTTPTFQTALTDFQNAVSEILPILKSNFPGALDETDDVSSNSPNDEKESRPAATKEFDEDEFLEQLRMDLERRGATDLPGASAKKEVSDTKSELLLTTDLNISLDVIKKPELCDSADFDSMFKTAEEEIRQLIETRLSCNANLEEARRLFASSENPSSDGVAESSPISKKVEDRVCLSIENRSVDRNRYQSKVETVFENTPFNTNKTFRGEDDYRKPPDSEAQSILKSSSRFVSNKHNPAVSARVTFSLSEESLEEVGRPAAPVHKGSGAPKSLFQTSKENNLSKIPSRKPGAGDSDR